MDHTSFPFPWIARFCSLIRKNGEVLDVACGGGRHTKFLTERGHPVTGIDRDLSCVVPIPGMTLLQVDLENDLHGRLAGGPSPELSSPIICGVRCSPLC